MSRYPAFCRFFIVLLGLWISVAPAFSIAPAAAMTQPGMTGLAAASGDDCCPPDDAKRSLCKVMCLNAGQVAIMPAPGEQMVRVQARYDVLKPLLMHGALPGPEPAPPKPASLL